MALKPPTPGLHRLHNQSKQTQKVTVLVAPYDELEVSDDVAAQLKGHSGAFADGAAPAWPDEWNPPADEPEEAAPAEVKPARKARKSTKKAAAKSDEG